MFTDTHCHLYSEYYEDIGLIIDKSKENNVNRWINNGCDNKTNKEVIKLLNLNNNMYGAIGIHPENIDSYKDEDISFVEKNVSNKKILAIGEIGLDYHYTKDNRDKQINLFESQLLIAEKNNIPVIIHSRDATQDTINIIKKYKVNGVIHSFSGSLETAKEYIKLGFLLGINGVITFKNSKLKEVIKEISLDNIVLETDSPYLSPEPYRGKQNNPSNIINIAKYICNLKNITLEELCEITNNNIKRIFNI